MARKTRFEKIEELINDISFELMSIMEPESVDEYEPVIEAFKEVKKTVSRMKDHGRLKDGCKYLFDAVGKATPQELDVILKETVSAFQAYLANPKNARFPHEKILEGEEQDSEWIDQPDSDFIADFVEKYTSLFEEFQTQLLEFQFNFAEKKEEVSPEEYQEASEDINAYVKSFVHTLKGDAGAVGLYGINKVCHMLEDFMIERRVESLTELFLGFKEWIESCLKALIEGTAPSTTPKQFSERLQAQKEKQEEKSTTEPPQQEVSEEEPAESASTDDEQQDEDPEITRLREQFPDANEELLAELLADEDLAKLIMNDSASDSSEDGQKEEPPAEAPGEAAEEDEGTREGEQYEINAEYELLVEFAVEAEDHLALIESTILDSSGQYSSADIDNIFRGIHSIKGASSFFNLKEVAQSSHLTENILGEVREGQREFDQGLGELVLDCIDLQRALLTQAKDRAQEDGMLKWNAQTNEYMARLNAYVKGESVPTKSDSSVEASGNESGQPELEETETESQAEETVPASGAVEEEKAVVASEGEKTASTAAEKNKVEVKTFVKVETKRLDQLIDAIGEMVIYSSMLIQNCRQRLPDDEVIIKTSHQVEKFSRDLQDLGMSMRLIPIKALFQKMSRIVWDVSKKIGKDIQFSMDGEDTELDRTIIEKLADPLMHMVRNAIDHGVEPPEEREAAGKPRKGKVHLSAYHAGGSIHIQIIDDGRGLDCQKLREKAIEKGIISEEQSLSEQEAFQLLFAAGFSTAKQVTDISGRGVGMDVVRRNIESMRGRVHIESKVGEGSKFTIELPLTLAIIEGIEVGVGTQSYIIPTLSVVEFMRPTEEMITRSLDRGEAFYFRGKYLPIYRLGRLFGVEGKCKRPEDAILIVVEFGGQQAAVMVDEILGTYSTVIKSLGDMFEQGKGVAGCAIMSNGDVALILDIRSLLEVAKNEYVFEHEYDDSMGFGEEVVSETSGVVESEEEFFSSMEQTSSSEETQEESTENESEYRV